MTFAIRPEQTGDEAAVRTMVQRAFAGQPYSQGEEHEVVDRLRADGDLLLSLVALAGETIVGQISFSPALLENGEDGWVVLGPLAVDPACQRQGVGRALIAAGEAAMRLRGARGMTVLGDPQFYARFGFAQNTGMWLAGDLGWAFQVKSLGAAIPACAQRYVRAFAPPPA